jgi:hypothetical protein
MLIRFAPRDGVAAVGEWSPGRWLVGLWVLRGQLCGGEDAPGVVLLCFEDVQVGEFCHRTAFAEWWEQQFRVFARAMAELVSLAGSVRTAVAFSTLVSRPVMRCHCCLGVSSGGSG